MVKGLKRITFGTTTIPESWMFTGGDEAKAVSIVLSVFLLETETGKILVDAGCDTMPGEGETEFEELCEFLKEQKLERVGAFAFSPEEGTPAAEMDFVDTEVAQARAQQIELLQSRIMDDYNASMQGQTVQVLVDGYDLEMEQYYGRTYANSPEIDARVWIASQDALREGSLVKVYIDGVADGDFEGTGDEVKAIVKEICKKYPMYA